MEKVHCLENWLFRSFAGMRFLGPSALKSLFFCSLALDRFLLARFVRLSLSRMPAISPKRNGMENVNGSLGSLGGDDGSRSLPGRKARPTKERNRATVASTKKNRIRPNCEWKRTKAGEEEHRALSPSGSEQQCRERLEKQFHLNYYYYFNPLVRVAGYPFLCVCKSLFWNNFRCALSVCLHITQFVSLSSRSLSLRCSHSVPRTHIRRKRNVFRHEHRK